MNIQQIKQAVDQGRTVCWSNEGYKVIKDKLGQYLIAHASGSRIGLTDSTGTKLNGLECHFFILEQ